jgi:monoamine oxidase
VILAVPGPEAARLLGRDPPALEDSPIVSVHLLFDRPLLHHRLAALLDSPAHWVFDRGALTGHEPDHGQYLTVVSSGVPDLLELRGRGLVETMADALRERLGHAELLWSRVSREPRATFAARPGTRTLRWPMTTSRWNVYLAGAWTASDWPATMEAAVRSGVAAAEALTR